MIDRHVICYRRDSEKLIVIEITSQRSVTHREVNYNIIQGQQGI